MTEKIAKLKRKHARYFIDRVHKDYQLKALEKVKEKLEESLEEISDRIEEMTIERNDLEHKEMRTEDAVDDAIEHHIWKLKMLDPLKVKPWMN